jgi:ElaA protein
MNLQWQTRRFDALQVRQLYQLLQFRQAVFIVEQCCAYQDLDDYDLESMHLLAHEVHSGELLAYARCLPPGIKYQESSIGRVAVARNHRGKGLGHELVRRSIDCCNLWRPETQVLSHDIRISAQAYLIDFYSQHGFSPRGDVYLEDGIKHQDMLRQASFP